MTIDTILAGNWALLVEEAAYDPESPNVISFRDGMVSDEDGQIGAYRIEGNTVFAPLGENVELEINPGNRETGAAAPAIPAGVDSLSANLRTSFEDGSDDLVEYAKLQRQA